jgi:hypothetical protein
MICEVNEKNSPILERVEGEERAFVGGMSFHLAQAFPETSKHVPDPREGGGISGSTEPVNSPRNPRESRALRPG